MIGLLLCALLVAGVASGGDASGRCGVAALAVAAHAADVPRASLLTWAPRPERRGSIRAPAVLLARVPATEGRGPFGAAAAPFAWAPRPERRSPLLAQAPDARRPRASDEEAHFGPSRLRMVRHIEAQGVRDSATLEAMRRVPRHRFVLPEDLAVAYGDHPLPIGLGQTISQPYIVAYMTEVLRPRPGMKVLEIGTGSGYQAAVLAQIGCRVRTMEIFRALADSARARLRGLGYRGVEVRHGDGHFGWPEQAPFDAVIVTAAAGYIPPALVDQLKPGGRMVIPVGSVHGVQSLILVDKGADGRTRTRNLLPVRFVPMLEGLR